MSKAWAVRGRPPRLERRFEFGDYEATRDFLDQAAELSEREGYYPDMSFGRTYVNVTIHAEEGAESVSEARERFAELLDALLEPTQD
jgi:pterin-4a-carbinolamine dehydratase